MNISLPHKTNKTHKLNVKQNIFLIHKITSLKTTRLNLYNNYFAKLSVKLSYNVGMKMEATIEPRDYMEIKFSVSSNYKKNLFIY